MTVALNYLRPKQVTELNTEIDLRIKASEKTNAPALVSPNGSTGQLDCRLLADPDPTGGVDFKEIIKFVFIPSVEIGGVMKLDLFVTPILGNGALGVVQTKQIIHDRNLDTWQTEAGNPRIDGADDDDTDEDDSLLFHGYPLA